MNKRLTADPANATRIRLAPHRTEGDWLTRVMPREGGLDEAARTFRAVVATATPVQRRDARGPFLEILDPAGLENTPDDDVSLLTDHRQSARETVGRASGFTVDGSAVHAVLRLGLADDVEPIFQRVKDGTLRHCSAGYRVTEWREDRDDSGRRTKTATRWRILEISLVPIPADPGAIIKRSGTMPFDVETRAVLIETLRHACKLPDEWGEDLGAETVTDDEVRAAALEAMTTRQAPTIRVTRSHDDPAAIVARASDGIYARMTGAEIPEASRDFANMSLVDLARDSLSRAGVSTRGMSFDEILHRSVAGTSDFPLVVSNVANKSVADAYRNAESPIKSLFRRRSLSDFKTATAIRLGGMGRLEELTEHGEIRATSRGEEGETIQLRTFARRFDLTRKLIVNDDLGLFGDVTRELGESAAATEADLCAQQLLGDGTLSDGTPLFHASRANIVTAAGSDLIADLSAARLALRRQKGLDGITPISVTPRYIVAGPAMETELEKVLAAINPADSDSVNPFAGRLQLLIDPRIEDADWYVFADPARAAVFNLAHLAAAPGPQIQRQEAWDTLGVSFRCFMDVGAGFAGWRGAVKVSDA